VSWIIAGVVWLGMSLDRLWKSSNFDSLFAGMRIVQLGLYGRPRKLDWLRELRYPGYRRVVLPVDEDTWAIKEFMVVENRKPVVFPAPLVDVRQWVDCCLALDDNGMPLCRAEVSPRVYVTRGPVVFSPGDLRFTLGCS